MRRAELKRREIRRIRNRIADIEIARARIRRRPASSTASADRPAARPPRAQCRRARRRLPDAAVPPRPDQRGTAAAASARNCNDQDRERTAKKRGIDQIVQQMAEAEPQRGSRRELSIAAADPAAGKAAERHRQAPAPRPRDATAGPRRSMPQSSARTAKPAIRIRRHAIGDRHGQEIARRGKRHHGRKQRQLDRFGQHDIAALCFRRSLGVLSCSRRLSGLRRKRLRRG